MNPSGGDLGAGFRGCPTLQAGQTSWFDAAGTSAGDSRAQAVTAEQEQDADQASHTREYSRSGMRQSRAPLPASAKLACKGSRDLISTLATNFKPSDESRR